MDPYVRPSHPYSVTSLMNLYQVYQIVLILKLAICVCDCKGELHYVYVIAVDTGNSVEASAPISVGGVTLQDLLLYDAWHILRFTLFGDVNRENFGSISHWCYIGNYVQHHWAWRKVGSILINLLNLLNKFILKAQFWWDRETCSNISSPCLHN